MIHLDETINDMLSDNYEDRFRAEYWQLAIRIKALDSTLALIQDNHFECDTPYTLLLWQREAMKIYLDALAQRATLENIDLL